MEEIILADRYAKALIACAQEENLIDQLEVELDMFTAILEKQTKLCEILCSPLISFKEKRKFLESIFKEQWVSPELKSFLYLLLKMRRFRLFAEIKRIYKDLIYSLRKRLKVFVESAFALDAKEKKGLKQKLSGLYQRNVDLFVCVNPGLIGGARLCVGHTIFDGTVRTKLSLLGDRIWKE